MAGLLPRLQVFGENKDTVRLFINISNIDRIENQEELTEKKEDQEEPEVQKQEEECPILSDFSSDEEKDQVRLFIDNCSPLILT